jgi:DNA polymerase III gamma/tau subunit
MILKAGITDTVLLGIPESLLPDLRKQADLFSKEDLLRLFDSFQKIESGMRYATQVRFQLEMGLMELAHIAKLRSLEDLIAEFTSITEGAASQAPKPAASPAVPPSTPPISRPAPFKTNPRPAPVPVPDKPKMPEPRRAAVSEPLAAGAKESAIAGDPRDLLLKIAAAIGREPLESMMQSLQGARLQGGQIVLEAGTSSEFVRKQIKENLSAITEAASRVVGNKITVLMGESEPRPASNASAMTDKPSENGLLEKAKREPVVRSFLDVFPGPVKAEKIDT